jgi:hypothetical protein
VRQQAVRAVIQRDTGFIAGRFNAKHQHGRELRSRHAHDNADEPVPNCGLAGIAAPACVLFR